MAFDDNVKAGFENAAAKAKQHKIDIGSLSALATTAKGSLVLAINELYNRPTGAINDAAPATTTTYSSSKIEAYVSQRITDLIAGAPAAFDTLKEIADYIGNDQSGAAATATALANRLRFDDTQALNATQKAQGNANLGSVSLVQFGSLTTDYVGAFNAIYNA